MNQLSLERYLRKRDDNARDIVEERPPGKLNPQSLGMETSGQCSCIHAYVATCVRNFSAALPGYANPPMLYDKGNRIITFYLPLT